MPATVGGTKVETVYLDLSETVARRAAAKGDIIAVTIERNGNTDGLFGDAYLIAMGGEYFAWTGGGHA